MSSSTALPQLEQETTSTGPFFESACVLLTGASGCVGKPFLAKLLLGRVGLPRKIYLILRAKGGKPAQDRVSELLDSPAFDQHRMELGGEGLLRLVSGRVVALDGDLSADGLGLSDEHRRQVISDCDVLISCAASVGFNEKLSFMRNANTLGALRMLQLARECQASHGGVRAFVHVSTAYVNVDRAGGSVVREKLYKPPLPVTEFLQMSDDELDAKEKELTNYKPACESAEEPICSSTGFPNTYSFSKRMAEHALDQEAAASLGFPIAIVRPAIIGCSVANAQSAQELAPLMFVPQILFSGIFISITLIPPALRWLQYVAALKYAINLACIVEFHGLPEGPPLLKSMNIDPDNKWVYMGVLLGICVGFRTLAMVNLRRKAKFVF